MKWFNKETKDKIKSALKPFIEGNYAESVKNPIALLNYLYQQEIIPKPVYDANSEFLTVTCTIGDHSIIGVGQSVKQAKNNSAQQFITLLLDNDVTSIYEESMCLDKDNECSSQIQLQTDIGLQQELQIPNSSNAVQQNEKPPLAADSITANLSTLPSPCAPKKKKTKVKSKLYRTEYFDPFKDVRPQKKRTQNAESDEFLSPNVPLIHDQQNQFKTNVSTQAPVAELASKTETGLIKKDENKQQYEKNVLQIMQEKSYKIFKKIPRCCFEEIPDGFQCHLQVDSFIGTGEGRSKKEAKLIAATSLLNVLNNNS